LIKLFNMKRSRVDNYTYLNGEKKTPSGKVIYRCKYCSFVACTEHNIEQHAKTCKNKETKIDLVKI